MLTHRQKNVLNAIVDDHIRTATPIASESLVRNHRLGVSSATVRNDLAHLEEQGYLSRPHSSAGCVPLDKAFRFHVEYLMDMETIYVTPLTQRSLRKHFLNVEPHVEEWTSVASTALSDVVDNMAIVTFPKAREPRVRHFELIPLQECLILVVVVLEQARLKQQVIRLSEHIEIDELTTLANRVKNHLVGFTYREISSNKFTFNPLEEKLMNVATLILQDEDDALYREHYVDGLRNLLNQPEFTENSKIRSLIESVEDRSLVQAVLEETPSGNIVKVVIGQENRGDILWQLSVVLCKYGIPNEAYGVVGVVGPTRMEYSRTIGAVKFMSSIMSEFVEDMSR